MAAARLVRPAGRASSRRREEADLDQALRGTLALDPPARRLSRLIEFLDPTDAEGIHARLRALVRGDARRLRLGVRQRRTTPSCRRLQGSRLVGFDVTDFLDHDVVRARRSRSICFIWSGSCSTGGVCAGWMSSGDCSPIQLSRASPRRPEDLAQAEWRHVPCDAERQRCARKSDQPHDHRADADQDLLPESRCERGEYIEGFGLTEREFKLIKEQLEPGSRQFLVKQGTTAWSASST